MEEAITVSFIYTHELNLDLEECKTLKKLCGSGVIWQIIINRRAITCSIDGNWYSHTNINKWICYWHLNITLCNNYPYVIQSGNKCMIALENITCSLLNLNKINFLMFQQWTEKKMLLVCTTDRYLSNKLCKEHL